MIKDGRIRVLLVGFDRIDDHLEHIDRNDFQLEMRIAHEFALGVPIVLKSIGNCGVNLFHRFHSNGRLGSSSIAKRFYRSRMDSFFSSMDGMMIKRESRIMNYSNRIVLYRMGSTDEHRKVLHCSDGSDGKNETVVLSSFRSNAVCASIASLTTIDCSD
jgi:hypothetical protein